MVVEIDEKSGFCFGVQNAVEIAEEALLKGEKVYSLGHIVHNDLEVERLKALGLQHIDHAGFQSLKNCKVLIRAHGEPPETYEIAARNGITIIEATCPIVRKLQLRIRNTWLKAKETDGQIVIFGKSGHAEVIGLVGQTDQHAIVTDGEKSLELIDFKKDIHLFSQTTMSISDYNQLIEKFTLRIKASGVAEPGKHLHVNNTICGQVANRQPGLRTFARKHDVIVFVSGRESSNGRMLFSVCRSENPCSWFVSAPEEVRREWFAGTKSAGVCGATSTPKWLIESVRDTILSFGL